MIRLKVSKKAATIFFYFDKIAAIIVHRYRTMSIPVLLSHSRCLLLRLSLVSNKVDLQKSFKKHFCAGVKQEHEYLCYKIL